MTRSFFDNNEPEKKAKAPQRIFEQEADPGRGAWSTQVLREFYVNATRKPASPFPPEVAEERVRVDPPLIPVAIARSRRMILPFRDALIGEAAFSAGGLRSEDLQHGQDTFR